MYLSAGLGRFKVINSLMQDAWVSIYKQTGPDAILLEP